MASKRARVANAAAPIVESAESRVAALLAVDAGSAATALLSAAQEWDVSGGGPSTDFFTCVREFVMALGEEDKVAKELFEESLDKTDETALEEVQFLLRSGVIDEAQKNKLCTAEASDRRRMLFVVLLRDSETLEGDADDHSSEGEEKEQSGSEDGDGEDPAVVAEQMREGAAAGCKWCKRGDHEHDCPHCVEGGWGGWAECSCPDGFHSGGGDD